MDSLNYMIFSFVTKFVEFLPANPIPLSLASVPAPKKRAQEIS